MIWLCVTPERREKTLRLMHALDKGISVPTRICHGAPPVWPAEFIVWGHLWIGAKLVARAVKERVPFWFIDNGFFEPAHGEATGYYSITRRALGPTMLADADATRLPVAMDPWRTGTDGYVLVALPGQSYGAMLGMDMAAWSRDIVAKVRQHTARPILVREKGCRRPLADDLAGAFVLVTHSSKVAVDAVRAGVPVIVAPTNPAAPVGSTDLADIEDPPRPDRAKWRASLMNQQFTIDEMRDGIAWRFMRKAA